MSEVNGGRGEVKRPRRRASGPSGLLPDRTEVRMMERAIREGWLSQEMREEAVDKLMEVMRTTEDDRVLVGAFKGLVSADSVDARREAIDVAAQNGTAAAAAALLGPLLRGQLAATAAADLTQQLAAAAREPSTAYPGSAVLPAANHVQDAEAAALRPETTPKTGVAGEPGQGHAPPGNRNATGPIMAGQAPRENISHSEDRRQESSQISSVPAVSVPVHLPLADVPASGPGYTGRRLGRQRRRKVDEDFYGAD